MQVKPSRNLRQLMYNRSRQGPNSKETGYKRIMAFVLRYHDLDGLRATMKQAMRVAGIRTFSLEVRVVSTWPHSSPCPRPIPSLVCNTGISGMGLEMTQMYMYMYMYHVYTRKLAFWDY